MYENITYEIILQRMLDKIPDSFDKREGSIIYDALAPAAAELQNMYIQLDVTRDLTFVRTSSSTYLDELVGEFGLSRIQATHATVKGLFNIEIPIGSRFSGDKLNYIAVERLSAGVYLLDCETAGPEGNAYIGRLIPIEYIDGLQTAEITEISIPAIDEETDQALKDRFFESVKGGAVDGNVRQYLKWAAEYPEVGKTKIFPLWDGPNTVKVSILNGQNEKASQVLINEFQEYLDPESAGLGNGVAPIGAIVTVTTAVEKAVNITVDVGLNPGYSTPDGVEESLRKYLHGLAYTADKVNFYEVAVAISSCDSISQISNLRLNGGMSDISLGEEEIPILNNLNIQVVTP